MSDIIADVLEERDAYCPSCKHPQHVGGTCGWIVPFPPGVTHDPSIVGPVRCGCNPKLAIKEDGHKQRDFDLFAWEALPELISIYQYGLKKGYLRDSWRNVEPARYRDALVRHLIEVLVHGESHADHESGHRSLAHLTWNAITLMVLTGQNVRK